MNGELPSADTAALRAAEGWLELGNNHEAAEAIEEVGFAYRNHPAVLFLRCRIYRAAQQPEPVLYLAQHATTVAPQHPAGWFELAWAFTLLGRRTEAEAAVSRCVELGGNTWKLTILDDATLTTLFKT